MPSKSGTTLGTRPTTATTCRRKSGCSAASEFANFISRIRAIWAKVSFVRPDPEDHRRYRIQRLRQPGNDFPIRGCRERYGTQPGISQESDVRGLTVPTKKSMT